MPVLGLYDDLAKNTYKEYNTYCKRCHAEIAYTDIQIKSGNIPDFCPSCIRVKFDEDNCIKGGREEPTNGIFL